MFSHPALPSPWTTPNLSWPWLPYPSCLEKWITNSHSSGVPFSPLRHLQFFMSFFAVSAFPHLCLSPPSPFPPALSHWLSHVLSWLLLRKLVLVLPFLPKAQTILLLYLLPCPSSSTKGFASIFPFTYALLMAVSPCVIFFLYYPYFCMSFWHARGRVCSSHMGPLGKLNLFILLSLKYIAKIWYNGKT